MLDEQAKHLAYIVRHAVDNDISVVEASEEAEADWVRTIIELSQFNQSFLESCTPGYYNNEGKPSERSRQNGNYGAGANAFIKVIEAWREEGTLAGLELS
jgi:cyclohexanone monooxygenase